MARRHGRRNQLHRKVGFHGTAPTAQQVLTTLATGATITTVVTSVQEIIEELQNKGLMGAN
jgi:methanogenic corrinoid protein MtbC1